MVDQQPQQPPPPPPPVSVNHATSESTEATPLAKNPQDKDSFTAAVQKYYDGNDFMKTSAAVGGSVRQLLNTNESEATAKEELEQVDQKVDGPDNKDTVESNASGTESASNLLKAAAFPSKRLKKPAHNRTVSWGIDSDGPPKHLEGAGSRSGSRSPIPRPPVASRNKSVPISKKGLDINDVINAGVHKESEAETYVLQAVEKMSAHGCHQPADTETSRLYNTIVEDELNSKASMGEFSFLSNLSPQSSPRSSISHDNNKHSPGRPGLTQQQSKRFHGFTATSHTKKDGGSNNSVEATLFDLASALNQLDGASDSQSHKSRHHKKDSSISYDNVTFSAADKLASAAQKIMHGKQTEELEHGGGGGGGGAGRGPLETVESISGSDDNGEASESNHDNEKNGSTSSFKKSDRKNRFSIVKGAKQGLNQEMELFNSYFASRKAHMWSYTRKIFIFVMLPSFGMAFFLFYVVENPELCTANHKNNSTNTTEIVPESPTMAPSLLPSSAPSVFEPWTIAWGPGNETHNATDTPVLLNDTDAPTAAPTSEPETTFDEFLTCPGLGASVSWWFLFMGVRQVVTYTLAMVTQSLIIDYFALSSRLFLDWLGPIVTLLVVQSKGWPFILTFWAIYNLILNCGDSDFAGHWLYWQDWIGLFNEDNPAGNVVSNEWNYAILSNSIIVGCAVAVKRLVVGLFLGRQTLLHFGEQLADVMKKMLIIGEVATLAREIANSEDNYREQFATQMSMARSGLWCPSNIQDMVNQDLDEANNKKEDVVVGAADAANAFMARRGGMENKENEVDVSSAGLSIASMRSTLSAPPASEFTQSQQMEISELLDEWEEPQTIEEREDKKVTIGAVLQFRNALAFMRRTYPFLPAFGPADTREACIQSAQRVYNKLQLRTSFRNELPFETLALLAKDEEGKMDKDKARELIKVFRPDRDGSLGKLEFVKSIDVVYKELRLLCANINNSSYMDAAVENIVNIGFYIILAAIIIYRLGRDPVALFISFSSVIIAFAFMFGRSASKYVDGCLFILIQRPYGVGDRMHLSSPDNDTNPDGSSCWIVESITLYTTSVYWALTNERATLCNGAISNLRVINAARSPNAVIYVPLKFPIDTDYELIEIFRSAVEQFLKDRPREWLAFSGFRPSRIDSEKGYIGYTIIAQHRNSWQGVIGVIQSKADLTTYCLEVAKQLGMRYRKPPLPVDLTMTDSPNNGIDMPILSENDTRKDDYSASSFASRSPKASNAQEAVSAFTKGLRQRKPAMKFKDLVRQVLEQDNNNMNQ